MQQTQATRPTATQAVQAQLAAFLESPVIEPSERAWHPSQLTEPQQRARAAQEEAMRAGQLRALPSCFGDLT